MLNGISAHSMANPYSRSAANLSSVPVSTTSINTIKVEDNQVSLSSEGKALLYALQEIERDNQFKKQQNTDVTEQVESFAHGALGIDHPDTIEEENDSSYSAGQYVSAALTVGGILLALV
jgi:hypothetical protein